MLLVPCLKKRDMPAREALPEAVAARYEAHLIHQEKIRGSSIWWYGTSSWRAGRLASEP